MKESSRPTSGIYLLIDECIRQDMKKCDWSEIQPEVWFKKDITTEPMEEIDAMEYFMKNEYGDYYDNQSKSYYKPFDFNNENTGKYGIYKFTVNDIPYITLFDKINRDSYELKFCVDDNYFNYSYVVNHKKGYHHVISVIYTLFDIYNDFYDIKKFSTLIINCPISYNWNRNKRKILFKDTINILSKRLSQTITINETDNTLTLTIKPCSPNNV